MGQNASRQNKREIYSDYYVLLMPRSLSFSESKWKLFVELLKLYLSMEEWFHDSNKKEEVRHSREQIGNVLRMLQRLFPRPPKTNGYKIPKMHGMTKMQEYMKLFGSGINFYQNTGIENSTTGE